MAGPPAGNQCLLLPRPPRLQAPPSSRDEAAQGGLALGAGGGGLNAFGLGASYSGGLSLASHSCCQLFSSRRGAGGLGGGAR